jgi:hypothetical protein
MWAKGSRQVNGVWVYKKAAGTKLLLPAAYGIISIKIIQVYPHPFFCVVLFF